METTQLREYIPVGILALVAFLFAAGTLVASVVVGKRGKRSAIKDTAYECGHGARRRRQHPPVGQILSGRHALYSVRYRSGFSLSVGGHLPPDARRQNAALILGSMICFLGILFIGYVYALKKQAFDWKK